MIPDSKSMMDVVSIIQALDIHLAVTGHAQNQPDI